MLRLIFIIAVFFAWNISFCQSEEPLVADKKKSKMSKSNHLPKGKTVNAMVIDGDTVPMVYLPYLNITSDRQFKTEAEKKFYYRLKKDVMRVYPYAKLAGDQLKLYNDTLSRITSERGRKKYMKVVEKGVKSQFGDELKSLTINQGRILIRLIDRETGDTSYELVKELRGTISAFFWQSLARIFGNNLKTEYDPGEGEDKMIEEIILLMGSTNKT